MKLLPLTLGLLAIPAWMTSASELDSRRLKDVVQAFEERHDSVPNDRKAQTNVHAAWLKSAEGKDDAAYLAKHYKDLSFSAQHDVPRALACTGLPEAAPLVSRALEDKNMGELVLYSITHACTERQASKEYRLAIAPALMTYIAFQTKDCDDAILILPMLDEEQARRFLLTDDFLSRDSPNAGSVLRAFSYERLSIPLERIEPLLKAWQPASEIADYNHSTRWSYCAAALALAAHDPQRAVALAHAAMKHVPADGYHWESVILAAAGLTGMYEELYAVPTEAEVAKLPHPARLCLLVTAFEAGLSGGLEQALVSHCSELDEVKKGYEEIGDVRRLELLEIMCEPFGARGPATDFESINKQMDAMTPRYSDRESELTDKWHAKYKGLPQEPETDWFLSLYAARQADVLRPLIEALRVKRKSVKY